MKLRLIVAIAAVVALPAYALAQAQKQPPAPKKPTKAEVQRVVQGTSADKTKSQKYCELAKLSEQIDEAEMRWLEVHEALEALPSAD